MQTPSLLSGERRIRCLLDFGKRERMRRTKRSPDGSDRDERFATL
jgi:hypothetical protein